MLCKGQYDQFYFKSRKHRASSVKKKIPTSDPNFPSALILFVIFQNNSRRNQREAKNISLWRKLLVLTFHPPFVHIPFSPVIATQNIWQSRKSYFHVKILYPPYSIGRSNERLNPRLSMRSWPTLPPFMALNTSWLWLFPLKEKVVNKTQGKKNTGLQKLA